VYVIKKPKETGNKCGKEKPQDGVEWAGGWVVRWLDGWFGCLAKLGVVLKMAN